ncbi:hypothetical protein NST12_16730 [Bacillus sp. FSL W8-1127]|uniref:hypothetical protein n=1 Tax=Bacillus sp. FSL W8-1127 TaxID=2954710 RepID=UPI0030FD0355
MKKYSEADVLGEEFSLLPNTNKFLGKLIYRFHRMSSTFLVIEVPLNIYLRAEIFCEDVRDLSETEFGQQDLMNLLYHDFLRYAQKNPDPQYIFQLLTSLDPSHGNKIHLQKKPNSSTFQRTEKPIQQQTLYITLRKKYALRGEVLLADMEEIFPNHGFTLEKIFRLLYCDFIEKLKKGENNKSIENILKLLED